MAWAQSVSAVPVITEFMASNKTVLADEDGSFSDWLEIYNPEDTTQDLAGWYLTDSAKKPTKWQFPAVTLAPRGYLVVFASGKDRRDPTKPLHTNFDLSAGGEYLGLIRPDGATIASEYAPTFPAQAADMSYGITQPKSAGGTPAGGILRRRNARRAQRRRRSVVIAVEREFFARGGDVYRHRVGGADGCGRESGDPL